jgi:hypothetical protein
MPAHALIQQLHVGRAGGLLQERRISCVDNLPFKLVFVQVVSCRARSGSSG